MKIVISMQYNEDFRSIAEITVPVMQRYAFLHGYSLFVHKCIEPSPQIIWQRLTDARMLLQSFDLVVHLDADILITNRDITIESVISGHDEEFVSGQDCNGLNDGFSVWRKPSLILYALQACSFKDSMQDAIKMMRQPLPLLPQRSCNSYLYEEYGMIYPDGQWQPGDFILHLPGMGNDRRVQILKEKTYEPSIP